MNLHFIQAVNDILVIIVKGFSTTADLVSRGCNSLCRIASICRSPIVQAGVDMLDVKIVAELMQTRRGELHRTHRPGHARQACLPSGGVRCDILRSRGGLGCASLPGLHALPRREAPCRSGKAGKRCNAVPGSSLGVLGESLEAPGPQVPVRHHSPVQTPQFKFASFTTGNSSRARSVSWINT